MTTLYDTLGVSHDATDEDIKRAYRKAAMKWHPDRNHGREDEARAAFQDIKDAYAILSDAAQRHVYDTVYAQQMSEWHARNEERRQADAQREAAARAADEAAYAEMVSVAIRFADAGHNRDVLFGVLLGRQCEPRRAAQIADSVAALQASRAQAAQSDVVAREAAAASSAEKDTPAPRQKRKRVDKPAENRTQKNFDAKDADTPTDSLSNGAQANTLSGLWLQFLNGLRF